MELNNDEIRRYSRHLILPEVGLSGQKKICSSSVLCIGAGGLGSPIAMYLAAAGIGKIGILDFDAVDFSNLQRQIIHGSEDEVCPRWMGQALYDACQRSARQIHLVDGGLHKDLWTRSPDDLVGLIHRFAAGLTRLPRPAPSRSNPLERLIDGTLRLVRGHVIRSAALDDASRR